VCEFETLRGAVNSVIQTIQTGIPVARIELLDPLQMRAINNYSHTAYRECPTLFLEFHGTPAGVAEQAETFGLIAADNGGGQFKWATRTEDRTALWEARHKVYYANLALRPGCQAIATDVCVPISRLCDCIEEVQHAIAASGLIAPIVGHVGDGNFHVILIFDPNAIEELTRARALSDRIVEIALSMEGTSTGEHGIGIGKKAHLLTEHGAAVEVMRQIKRAIDPSGIMNPEKVVDL
jgi:D-lactate dehydrogenase (cytochrome)